jgi:hypothetical protein
MRNLKVGVVYSWVMGGYFHFFTGERWFTDDSFFMSKKPDLKRSMRGTV